MSFTAVYDANVLYPASLRDLLIRLGQTGLYRARWTDTILDEVMSNLLAKRSDLDASRLARTRRLMCDAVADCIVEGYESLIAGIELPDPDDRHVLAAAIRCHAQVIVTTNIVDFPEHELCRYGIEAQTPDQFVLHLVDLAPATVASIVQQQADALRRPSHTFDEILDRLIHVGLKRSVAALREHLQR